ncbi:hypothetical protein ACLB2K_033930 [Fragaria x ananassa]
MLYLLVMYPSMPPCYPMASDKSGSKTHACAEAIEFFEERKCKGDKKASKALPETLQLLETEEKWDNKKKWKVISHVWVEMLSYAASHCPWNQHARQLRRCGELLTHVWLLMAHLGITEQFQISKGHARAKWIVQ